MSSDDNDVAKPLFVSLDGDKDSDDVDILLVSLGGDEDSERPFTSPGANCCDCGNCCCDGGVPNCCGLNCGVNRCCSDDDGGMNRCCCCCGAGVNCCCSNTGVDRGDSRAAWAGDNDGNGANGDDLGGVKPAGAPVGL